MRYLMMVTRKHSGSQTMGFHGGRRAMLDALPLVIFALSGSQNTASVETCNAAEQFASTRTGRDSWHWGPFNADYSVTVRRYPESDYKG